MQWQKINFSDETSDDFGPDEKLGRFSLFFVRLTIVKTLVNQISEITGAANSTVQQWPPIMKAAVMCR